MADTTQSAQHTPGPSEDARTLLHYAEHSRGGCADDSDAAYCAERARVWAEHIITKATGSSHA